MRPSGLIEKAIEILKENTNATSVRSMTRIKEHLYRAWKQYDDDRLSIGCGQLFVHRDIHKLELKYYYVGDTFVYYRYWKDRLVVWF
jgi:hypothetical protein